MCSAAFEPLPGTQGTCPALFSFRNLFHCNLERFLACCNNVDAVSKAERTVFAAVNKLAVGGVNVNRGFVAVNGDNVTVYAHAFCVIGGIVYVVSQKLYEYMKRHNNNHAHFPFEKVVMALAMLFITSWLVSRFAF